MNSKILLEDTNINPLLLGCLEVSVSTESVSPGKKETVQTNFSCYYCFKSFSTKKSYTEHIECVHEKKKRFRCKLCQKEFGRRKDVKKHARNVHKWNSQTNGPAFENLRMEEKVANEKKKMEEEERTQPKITQFFSSSISPDSTTTDEQ